MQRRTTPSKVLAEPPHSARFLCLSGLILAAVFALGGCTTVRSVLQPMVCDCASEEVACSSPEAAPGAEEAEPILARQIVHSSHQIAGASAELNHDSGHDGDELELADDNGDDDDELDEGFGSDDTVYAMEDTDSKLGAAEEEAPAPAQPEVRTLRRTAAAEPVPAAPDEAHEVIDPLEPGALLDLSEASARAAFQESHGVSVPAEDGVSVMSGDFVRGQETTAAVVTAGKNLRIYSEGRLAAQKSFAHHKTDVSLEQLAPRAVQPVRLVRGAPMQVLVHFAEAGPDGSLLYKVAIYKVIGMEVGTVFEQTLARQASVDEPVQMLGRYEILRGLRHRFIRWTPIGEDGEALEPTILRWNRWEGVYRIPGPPPTAPKRRS